jgi:hypothetical protein
MAITCQSFLIKTLDQNHILIRFYKTISYMKHKEKPKECSLGFLKINKGNVAMRADCNHRMDYLKFR